MLRWLTILLLLVASAAQAQTMIDVSSYGYDQKAMDASLEACGVARGCRLYLPAGTYNGALVISDKRLASFELECAPGAKIAIPANTTRRAAILVGGHAPNNGSIHGCEIDGQKNSMPYSQITRAYGVHGVSVSNKSSLPGPDGWHLYDLNVHDVMKQGIFVTNGSNVEIGPNVTVRDVGCETQDACPGLTRCENRSGNCVDAFGIFVSDFYAASPYVHDVLVERASKMCVESYTNSATYPGTPPTNVRFENITARHCGLAGIAANGAATASIRNSLVEETGGRGATGNNGMGILVTGISSNLTISGNTVRGARGHGIQVIAAGVNTITENRIESACKGVANIAALAIGYTKPLNNTPIGTYVLRGNRVMATPGGACRYGVYVNNVAGGSITNDVYELDDTADVNAHGGYFTGLAGRAFEVKESYFEGGAGPAIVIHRSVVGGLTIGPSNSVYHPKGPACAVSSASKINVCKPATVTSRWR